MKNSYEPNPWLLRLIWLDIIEGVIVLLYIFFNPAGTKNSVFLGFTSAQWAIIGWVGFIFVFHILVMWELRIKSRRPQFWEMLNSPRIFYFSSILLLVLFLFVYFIYLVPGAQAYLSRLAPLLVYSGLILIQVAIVHLRLSKDEKAVGFLHILETRFRVVEKFFHNARICSLIFSLILCVPALFLNSLRNNIPLGYAGMFTLMAEEISKLNFRLPLTVPYYGPGGVPFAYPPLGLYLMAFFIRLKLPVMVYLRFFPPLIALLALAILFYLVIEISNSTLAAGFSTLLAASSYPLYETHLWAAGVVRGLAFALLMAALYFFVRTIKSFSWMSTLMSGVSVGLLALTHLAYPVFFVAWVFGWLVTHPKLKNLYSSLTIGLVGGAVASPWVSLVVKRYGLGVFENALSSHKSAGFLPVLQNFSRVIPYLQSQLGILLANGLLVGLVLIGCVYLIYKAQYGLPIVLVVVTIFIYENDHYLVFLGAIIISVFMGEVYQHLGSVNTSFLPPLLIKISSLTLACLLIGYFYVTGFRSIIQDQPTLSLSSFELAQFVQRRTATNASYLLVTQQDEAEWFPYLFERQPLVGQWGSEWLGTYYQQTDYLREMRQCEREQDLSCLRDFIAQVGKTPDYLITVKTRKKLSEALTHDLNWENVYENSRYLVWRYEG